MEALLKWAGELGVSDSLSPSPPSSSTSSSSPSSCLGRSLVVADFPNAGGRGLAAARDLRRGELVLRAPRAALLTSDRVTSDDARIAACVSAHRPRLSSVQMQHESEAYWRAATLPAGLLVFQDLIHPIEGQWLQFAVNLFCSRRAPP